MQWCLKNVKALIIVLSTIPAGDFANGMKCENSYVSLYICVGRNAENDAVEIQSLVVKCKWTPNIHGGDQPSPQPMMECQEQSNDSHSVLL